MTDKRAAGAEWLRTLLQATDDRYTVDERVDAIALFGKSARDRDRLMGRPIRYALFVWAGRGSYANVIRTAGDRPAEAPHLFEVNLWHEVGPDTAEVFEDLLEGPGGILHGIQSASLAIRTPSGRAVEVGDPVNVESYDVELLGGTQKIAHYARFNITLT